MRKRIQMVLRCVALQTTEEEEGIRLIRNKKNSFGVFKN